MEDRRLIHRCKRGDRDAFCRLYEKYRNLLFTVAVALLRDVHAAEDVVQDVFVQFAERIADFRLTGSLKAYLSVCVANRAKNALVSRKKDCALSENQDFPSNNPGPEHQIICNEELRQLSEAMEKLPIEQRQIIALRHYSRMPIKTIAQSLNLSPNTAKSRYRYGMDKLRQMLMKKNTF
ncbi:MAG: RNA polymerase sigma factor [Planctomycetota bacterium]|jgi:RNA polymerase sigma-70 factor (ECF subfamily)